VVYEHPKDTCIRVSLSLEKDFCTFHTTELGNYFCEVENKFYFAVVVFNWGPICHYFSPVSYLGYTETLHSEQDPVYTLLMQLLFLTSSVTDWGTILHSFFPLLVPVLTQDTNSRISDLP